MTNKRYVVQPFQPLPFDGDTAITSVRSPALPHALRPPSLYFPRTRADLGDWADTDRMNSMDAAASLGSFGHHAALTQRDRTGAHTPRSLFLSYILVP
jgi:hypothetical protein